MTSIIYLVAWDEICHLPKPIQHHKDRVYTPLGPRKPKEKVYAYIYPGYRWNG